MESDERLENLKKQLSQKNQVISDQKCRIEELENEVEKLRKEPDALTGLTNLAVNSTTPESRVPENHRVTHSGPGSLQRASSTGSAPPAVPTRLQHQRSISSHARLQRQRSLKKPLEDDKLKHSRRASATYELSQDLHDKQVEMLEKKYGGSFRTRHAAKTIQQAFRQYSMNKNFERLRNVKGEKRLERRYTEHHLQRSDSVWEDVIVDTPHSHARKFDQARRNLNDNVVYMRSRSEQETRTHKPSLQRTKTLPPRYEGTEQIKGHRHGGSRKHKIRHDRSVGESNNNGTSCSSSHDPCPALSPDVTPHVDYENVLQSKETDILSAQSSVSSRHNSVRSDHGESIATSVRETDITYEDYSITNNEMGSNTNGRTSLIKSGQEDVTFSISDDYNISEDNSYNVSDNQIKIQVDLASPMEYQNDNRQVRIYANTEVTLRNKHTDNDGATSETTKKASPKESPIWKRKSPAVNNVLMAEPNRMSNISEASEGDSFGGRLSSTSSDTTSVTSDGSLTSYQRSSRPSLGETSYLVQDSPSPAKPRQKLSEKERKRQYRIGLNQFNKKPEKGLRYLIERKFVENSSRTVARFLITRKGLSKQMIGEYLGNLQNLFNQDVLDHFIDEMDFAGLTIDVALRKYQTYFRMPGEAQKIERLMEAFAHRYCVCNPDFVDKTFRSQDTIFLLAFAIIMLNTDLHNPSIKSDRKMKVQDFIKNLRGIDNGHDIDREFLVGIYERVKNAEFRAGVDHVTQVLKVEQTVVGKKPQLTAPHRRLVCYCRLYEVIDLSKKEKLSLHQREIFLFNDTLLVTKIFSKKKSSITYSYRHSFPLINMQVFLFETPHYQFGVQLKSSTATKVLITFNARNEHDREKFVDDLKEAIAEMTDMEQLRIEEELQKHLKVKQTCNRHSNDSGMVDYELLKPNQSDPSFYRMSAPEHSLKKTVLSNSLIDLSEGKTMERRGSAGSLDSGMVSVSSVCGSSREESPQQKPHTKISFFGRHEKKNKSSKANVSQTTTSSSEV